MASVYDDIIGSIRQYDASYNTDPADGEKAEDHIARLTRYVARDLPEAGWDALSNDAKDWHDNAIASLKNNQLATEPAGYPEKPAISRRRAAIDDDAPRRRAVVEDDSPKVPTVWDHIRAGVLAYKADEPVDRAPAENVDDHLQRILRFLGRTMPEAHFDNLPTPVKDWYEQQAVAGERTKERSTTPKWTAPPGYPEAAPAAATGNGAAAPADDVRRTRQTAGDGEANATDRVIDYVLKYHHLPLDKLKDAMDKAESGVSDLKTSTRATVAANAVKVIVKAKAAGHWKTA